MQYIDCLPIAWQFIISFLIGSIVGSFLNVIINRLPKMLFSEWQEASNTPRIQVYKLLITSSHCPKCYSKIACLDNIPLLSFIILRAKCRSCNAKISWRYPLVELISGIFSAFLLLKFGWNLNTSIILFFTWCLIVLSVIDFEHYILPDEIIYPILWSGLLYNNYLGSLLLIDAVWGVIIGYTSLWIVCYTFYLCTGKIGMGHGDFKLMAAVGAWVGWQNLSLVIFMASSCGSIIGIIYIITKKIPISTAFPFGPYIAISGWLSFLYGDNLYFWYQ